MDTQGEVKHKNRIKNIKKTMWITPQQNDKLKRLAGDLGMNEAQIFRTIIDGDYIYINLYMRILNELKKQGVNLNQITRKCNENDIVSKYTLNFISLLLKQQKEIKEELYKIRGINRDN